MGGSVSGRGKGYRADGRVALRGKGGAGDRLRLELRLGFRILWFRVVVVGRLALLGGNLPTLNVHLFGATTACLCRHRRHRRRRRLYNLKLRRGNEEIVRHSVIVVDLHWINEHFKSLFGAGRAIFRKYGFVGTYACVLIRSPCSRFYTGINTVHVVLIDRG